LDDQDFDPIADALSAVSAQFAGEVPKGLPSQPDAAETLDAATLPYDDEEEIAGAAPDDPDADPQDASSDDTDTDAAADADAPTFDWDSDANPYKSQAIQTQQQLQKHELARTLFQRIQDRQQAEAEENDARALIAQLQEVDPQLAETYSGQRQGLIQRTAQAQQETAGWQHGMAALVMAMNEVLGPDAVAQVRELGSEIARHRGLDQMQGFIQTRQQAAQSANARVAELEEALRLALLQNGARQRPAAADRVDSAPAARAKIARPEDADNMDDFMEALTPMLNQHFGAR
jgi:hypothetical protein